MIISWSDFKTFVEDKSLSIQFLELDSYYRLAAIDGPFIVYCELNKSPSDTTNLDDFEANYKPSSNQPVIQRVAAPEKAILRMCKAKLATTAGIATVEVKVPGVMANGDGRYIEGGEGWFETFHEDDYFEVFVKDIDNVLGYGAGFVVGSYTEDGLTAAESGWYIPLTSKKVSVAAMAGLGWVPAELYLCVVATKGNLSADTFRMNFKWGVKDVG